MKFSFPLEVKRTAHQTPPLLGRICRTFANVLHYRLNITWLAGLTKNTSKPVIPSLTGAAGRGISLTEGMCGKRSR